MSPTRIPVAKLQFGVEQRVDQRPRARAGRELRLAPMTCWPSALLSMPMTERRDLHRAVGQRRLDRPLDVEAERRERRVDDVEDALRVGVARLGEVDGTPRHRERADARRCRSRWLVAPDCCVAVPVQAAEDDGAVAEGELPMSAVAVAVRVAPLSMEACALDVRPLMAEQAAGHADVATVVVESCRRAASWRWRTRCRRRGRRETTAA